MSYNRRNFIRQISGTAALLTTSLQSFASEQQEEEREITFNKNYSANDKIRLAGIGMGIQGYQDVNAALKVPGTELIACCDLYTGRLEHAKEVYGDHLFTTKRYEEIIDRTDIDAIILATGDSWHSKIAIEAMKKGKAVYCEKPMVHKISEGLDVINAQKQSGKTMQVGSQRVSSFGYAKAKELYEAGEIGTINAVEAVNNRQSFLGAWQYTIPTDASERTVDWNRFQSNIKTKHPYEDKRFFWWRNYREYGTGVAGDLFVHLLSGLHFITGSKGPTKIYSLGDLTFWKDGRDMPDIMNAVLQYPSSKEHAAFQVTLSVNFVSGEGETGYTKITGTDGVMIVSENKVTVKRRKMPKAPGIGGWDSLGTFTKEMQAELLAKHSAKYAIEDTKSQILPDLSFVSPEGVNHHVAHLANFLDGVRNGKPVVEDATFGFRAAAPCLACNESYFQDKVINWDPVKMKLV
ncbi:MAG: Gfo/Idh/MocA family oxidoreductase [Bacteroidota bacterium]